MPKNYNDIYTSVYTTGNSMSFGNSMLRGNGIPLDITEVYDSFDKAILYAATNAVAYEGQILAVTENGDTDVYVITPASQGTKVIEEVETTIYLKKVGTIPMGDDQSIEVVDGKIQIRNFNNYYFKYTTDESGVVSYVKTEGFKEGLEPKVVKKINEEGSVITDEEGNPLYEIAWYEPSATTVEGLSSTVATLSQEVANKATKAESLAGYGIKDAYTKGEVDGLIASAGTLKREIVTELPAVDAADPNTIYMVLDTNIITGDRYKEYMLINGEIVQIGDTSVDLDDYVTDDELAEALKGKVNVNGTDRLLTEAEGAIIDKLKNLSGNEQVNVIDGVSEEFVISADGKVLSVKEIAQSKITGLTTVLDELKARENYIKAVDINDFDVDEDGKLLLVISKNSGKNLSTYLDDTFVKQESGKGLISDADLAKLTVLPEDAEANIIDKIKLGNVDAEALAVADKAVVIPIATTTTLGLVKSVVDDGENDITNKVLVAEDGTMSIKAISVSAIYQNANETLILNGGSAAI